MYIGENKDSNTGKRGAEDEYDERCPKRIKVDVHRVDDTSPCKTVVKSSQVAKGSEINLHKDDNDKTEDAVDNSVKDDENAEVTGDEETEDDEKSGTDKDNEQTTSTEEKEEKTETVSKDSENKKETIGGSKQESKENEQKTTEVDESVENTGKDGDQVMVVSGIEIASTTLIEQTDHTEVASERDSKDQEENKTETEVKAVTSDVRADEGNGENIIEGTDTSEKDGQVVNEPSSPQTPSISWTDATDASSPQIPRDDDDSVQEIPSDQEILPPKKKGTL